MRELQHRTCLVTGAASGIGRAFALELARQDVRLLLVDVQADSLAQTVAECQKIGAWTQGLVCDLTNSQQIQELCQAILEQWGKVDILVNNAGILYYGPTEQMTQAQWDRIMQVNLLAPIQLIQALLPAMLTAGAGHILNVCSISGLVASNRFAAYNSSKFGLIGLSEALRNEYNRRGIGITALCPGPVQTRLYTDGESCRRDRQIPVPPAWLCATPEQVAQRGVKAIRRNQARPLITPLAHVTWQIKKWCPWLLSLMTNLSKKQLKWSYWFPAKAMIPATPPEPLRYAGALEQKIPAPHLVSQSVKQAA
jgi:3-oxoacyl-[acyl-carrier protein] reductase